MDVCGSFPFSTSGASTISVLSDFIATNFSSTDLCSHPLNGDSNTLTLISPVDGANMCRSYPHARNAYTRSEVPSGFSVTENINTNECEHLFDFSYNTSLLQSIGGSGDDPDPGPQVAESYDWLVPIIALILN